MTRKGLVETDSREGIVKETAEAKSDEQLGDGPEPAFHGWKDPGKDWKIWKRGILMEELHKKWEKIHHCLQALEAADQEQEAEILKKAYECLLCAYQESRALNDEMEMLVKDTLTS